MAGLTSKAPLTSYWQNPDGTSRPLVSAGTAINVRIPLLLLCSFPAFLAGPSLPGQQPSASTQFQELEKQFETNRQPRKFIEPFLAFARTHADDPKAIDALTWVLKYYQRGPEADRALRLLANHHAGNDQLVTVFQRIGRNPSLAVGQLYRAVLKQNKDPQVLGNACMRQTEYLLRQLDLKQEIESAPEKRERYEQFLGKAIVDHLRSLEIEAVLVEAELLCRRIETDFAEIRTFQGILGDLAERKLFTIRHLSIGRPAANITGDDVFGKRLQLSDFQGKVVVIDFWADWCLTCRTMYSSNRELVGKMEGRPFVLLGVNSDRDRKQTTRVIRTQGLNWRSWWDGGSTTGPIAKTWNIETWPAIYVLDHQGVIRYKNIKGTELLGAVEKLVSEAEK